MKRRFTILTAALALLAFLAIPMGMMGQTRTTQTAFYGFETGDAGWTATAFVTNNTAITAHGGSKYGATNGGSSADIKYNTIVESPQSLTCYYTKTTTNTNAGSKFHIQVSSNNSTWTTVASGLGMDQVTKGTWYELTADLSSYSNVYVRVRYDGTSAVRALDDITLIYDDGNTPSTDPEITFTPTSITLDEVLVGNEFSTTFSVAQTNLTTGITLSVDNGSLSTSSIAQGAAATNVTWTYTPTTAGAISATVTATSGTTTETLAISGTAIAPVEGYDVDFEYASDMYPNWTFDNMTTYQTGSITAHGGTYYGTTGGKATASVTTTSIVANPGTLTCYVSKQSGNTTSSTWYIQVSENGSTWTDVESHSATSMSQGSWVEFTADLSSYSNVYVRVYYSGSTAIRNIDDLTLTIRSSVADPTFSPVSGTTFGDEGLSVTISQADNEDIYYSLDGTEPTTSSTLYSGAIALTATTTIKAIASDGTNTSNVVTATYTYVDPNAPGTQNNPYTVAQARAAIDANSGTQGVYATGIVSAIPTAYNSTYGNVTFNMVDEEGDEVFLQAYRCGGDEAANVAVGDVVVVYGNLTKYGSTYEFGQGCTLVSLTHPVITTPVVTVTPNTISAPAEGVDGTLTITYENITEIISFDYYFCDADGNELEGDDPDWIYAEINEENDAYTLSYIIDANDGEARTAYMKVYTFDDNLEEVYAIVTINQEEYVAPTYAELPFAFNSGKAAINETDGLYQDGLGDDYNENTNPNTQLKFDGTGDWLLLQFDERPGTLTFDIKGNSFSGGTFKVQTSADGVSYSDLETYTSFGNNETYEEEFDNLNENVRYIKWIYTQKVSGNVGLGNIALAEYVAPVLVASITVNPDVVNVDATPAAGEDFIEGTLDLTYENLTITDMDDFDIQYYDAEGEETTQPDWIEVLVAEQDPEIGEGYVVSYYMVENEGPDARTAYFKVYAMDDETNLVYSNMVTVNQAAPVAPVTGDKYVKVTSTADLTSGQYLIVYEDGGLAFNGSLETLDAVGNTIEVTISNNEIEVNTTTAASEFTIDVTAGTIKSASGYYIGQTSDANGLASSTTNAYTNTITFEDGNANIVSGGAYLRYNSASNQNRFRYYKSSSYSGQKAIQLYKKVGEPYTLNITGYGTSTGGYYLIASPVTVDPATVDGMTEGDYDLYYFDQTEEKEWQNYKDTDGTGYFNLVPGKGYLYAHKTGGQFTLTGTPYSGDGKVTLNKTNDTNADFQGWNLVGNPFAETAHITSQEGHTLSFYTLTAEGDEFEPATNTSVERMEGVFVVAQEDGEKITFTKGEGAKGSLVALNLSNGRNVIDRTIVRFDECRQLPKFQLNPNHTKVYIPVDGEDYALVRGEEMGAMPVNFKAENNGTYTLSLSSENVEFAYLHLIDNMTGADIDLLQTPSYSFEAKTTDYANRFKLVYATGDNSNDNNFAFFSNGSFVINNEGDATLQVVDVTGRIVKSESINGCANVSVNAAPGVYMLRLVNGDNMKIQKVVVK